MGTAVDGQGVPGADGTGGVPSAIAAADLARENAALRERLGEAEDTLRALRAGELDAIVVGDDLFVLRSAEAMADRFRGDVLAQMDDAVVVASDEQRIVFLNAAAERQYGVAASQALGQPVERLFVQQWLGAGDAAAARAALESADGTWRGRCAHRVSATGATLLVEGTWSRMRDADGAPIGVLSVLRDVTGRAADEAAVREASQRKDEFLATLAHELRNPLAPIRTGLALLRRSPEQGERVLGIMERQLDQLVRLVDDLMDVARFTNGKIALRRERLDPAELLDAAVEACRPALDAAGHVLTVRMAEQPLRVLGDRVRLVQVVSNLLANAIKYSDAGSPIALELAQDDAHVLIRVRDHGVGVDPAMMPRLWDMFGQVRGTLRRAQGGLGIGLSLVKRLVEMHDGAVGVQSEGPGYGSTFTVRLPRMRIETGTRGRGPQAVGATPASAPPSIGADGTAAPLRVLVVDDNADGADCLAEALRMAGHRVVVAYDARQALASAAREPPDAVLLDLGLPDLDGFDVARRLRSAGGTRRARLVAISGWGSHADRQRSRDAGIDVHLTKPAALSEVLQALEQGALRQAGSAR